MLFFFAFIFLYVFVLFCFVSGSYDAPCFYAKFDALTNLNQPQAPQLTWVISSPASVADISVDVKAKLTVKFLKTNLKEERGFNHKVLMEWRDLLKRVSILAHPFSLDQLFC